MFDEAFRDLSLHPSTVVKCDQNGQHREEHSWQNTVDSVHKSRTDKSRANHYQIREMNATKQNNETESGIVIQKKSQTGDYAHNDTQYYATLGDPICIIFLKS